MFAITGKPSLGGHHGSDVALRLLIRADVLLERDGIRVRERHAADVERLVAVVLDDEGQDVLDLLIVERPLETHAPRGHVGPGPALHDRVAYVDGIVDGRVTGV